MLTAILLSIGVTHVWARGTIFARLRALYPPLLDCPLCAGVWISFCVQLGLWILPTLTVALGIACVSASASLALYGLIRAIPVRASSNATAAEHAAQKIGGPARHALLALATEHRSSEDAAFVARRDGMGRGFW